MIKTTIEDGRIYVISPYNRDFVEQEENKIIIELI